MSAPASSVACSGYGASVSVMEPYTPHAESVILLMKRVYWERIIVGEKTLEIRCKCFKPMKYFVGARGEIWGSIVLGQGQEIDSDDDWQTLLSSHCWFVDKRPYQKTCAMPIEEVELFTKSLAYATRRGQQSTAKYRPVDANNEASHGEQTDEATHGEQADARDDVRIRKRPSAAL